MNKRLHRLPITKMIALFFLIVVLISCDLLFKATIRGSGIIIDETRQLDFFHTVDMSIAADLVFSLDAAQSFRIVGDDNIVAEIQTEVRGNTLEIFTDKNYKTDHGVQIYISMQQIKGFSLSGAGTIQGLASFVATNLTLNISGSGSMDMDVTANQINSTISGSGSIFLSGTINTHIIDIPGSGEMRALGLDTLVCEITISGSGNCYVFVRDVLDVDISGSGNVYYTGTPAITSRITGSGDIISLD